MYEGDSLRARPETAARGCSRQIQLLDSVLPQCPASHCKLEDMQRSRSTQPKPGEKAVHRSLSPIARAAAGDRRPGFLGTGLLSITAALTGSEPVPWTPKCHTETQAVAKPGAGPPSQSQLQWSSPRRSSSSFRTPLTENSAEQTENNQHSSLRINEGPFLPELRCPGFVSPGFLHSAGCCVS